MSTWGIVLLVLFTVVMAVWLLSLLGTVPGTSREANYGAWLAFFACLILGVVVFLGSAGVVVLR